MMNTLVIKAIIILSFAFSLRIFASSWCEIEGEHQHEEIITNENNGMITTKKYISYHKGSHTTNDRREEIVTIYDQKGNLLFSKNYTYIGNKLVQTIDDGIVRNIVQGKTPCYFTIVEQSGDSIFFHLDVEKEPENVFFKDPFAFSSFFSGHNIRYPEDDVKYDIYDAIIYQWYFRCKDYYETQESQKKKGNRR